MAFCSLYMSNDQIIEKRIKLQKIREILIKTLMVPIDDIKKPSTTNWRQHGLNNQA